MIRWISQFYAVQLFFARLKQVLFISQQQVKGLCVLRVKKRPSVLLLLLASSDVDVVDD